MTKNFIELINEYQIIIPLIQRDYAQGRKEETSKANNFLNAIFNGLEDGLNLDFIYGKAEDNIFTPLDGQQRLTTLLLLHWYTTLENKHLKSLENFSYKVRSSTKDFIEKLTDKENWKEFKKVDIKESIENASWFFLSWKNDPTVLALLHMLDLIENKFQGIDVEQLNNITFEILYLNDFKLTDDLYVKMNARGKPLTLFENFKAEFENYIDDNITKAKLDNQWLDIFWKVAQKTEPDIENAPKSADDKFYNFFYNVTLNLYLEKDQIKIDNKQISKIFIFEKDKYREIKENTNLNDLIKDRLYVIKNKKEVYIFKTIDDFINNISIFDFYETVYNKQENIDKVVLLLDNLKDCEYFRNFIDDKKITQWERARFYALSLGYIKGLDEIEFDRWERVTFNLINNQLIQSPNDLMDVIQSLKLLSENCSNDIYAYIDGDSSKIKSFTKLQREEESLKVSLIANNLNWENELIEAEKHSYLNGQIGFLLKYAENDLDRFIKYRNNFKAIWNLSSSNPVLIYQALLTKGDYLPASGSNYTFCSFKTAVRTKLDNWQKVFNNDKLSLYLKELLDDSRININNIQDSLQKIIDRFIEDYKCEDSSYQENYLFSLISNRQNIEYCDNLQLRYYNDGKEVYLLKRLQMNGTHVELYSWNLFTREFQNKEFSLFPVVKYIATSSSYEKPYIVLDGFKNRYTMDISFDESFKIRFFKKKHKKGKIEDEIVKILERNSFTLEGKKYILKDINLCSEDSILPLIEKIIDEV